LRELRFRAERFGRSLLAADESIERALDGGRTRSIASGRALRDRTFWNRSLRRSQSRFIFRRRPPNIAPNQGTPLTRKPSVAVRWQFASEAS